MNDRLDCALLLWRCGVLPAGKARQERMNWQQIYDRMDERQRFEVLTGMFKRLRWARLLHVYTELPYILRRLAFNWSDRVLFPAHWVR